MFVIEDRKTRKRESNRRAAHKFRIKKKTEMKDVALRLAQLRDENAQLEFELELINRFRTGRTPPTYNNANETTTYDNNRPVKQER